MVAVEKMANSLLRKTLNSHGLGSCYRLHMAPHMLACRTVWQSYLIFIIFITKSGVAQAAPAAPLPTAMLTYILKGVISIFFSRYIASTEETLLTLTAMSASGWFLLMHSGRLPIGKLREEVVSKRGKGRLLPGYELDWHGGREGEIWNIDHLLKHTRWPIIFLSEFTLFISWSLLSENSSSCHLQGGQTR